MIEFLSREDSEGWWFGVAVWTGPFASKEEAVLEATHLGDVSPDEVRPIEYGEDGQR